MTDWMTARTLWWIARGRIIAARRDNGKDLGASALEWAIISATLVGAAIVIGTAVYNRVQKSSSNLNDCSGAVC